jgi:hypothetical protein
MTATLRLVPGGRSRFPVDERSDQWADFITSYVALGRRRARQRVLVLALVLAGTLFLVASLVAVPPLHGQQQRPLMRALHGVAGGVTRDVAVRAPYVAFGWQKPLPRILLATIATELLIANVRALVRRHCP